MSLSEQELQRRQCAAELQAMGIDPWPAEGHEVNVSAAEIREHYPKQKIDFKDVSIAGRLMSRRIMGKASFAHIQDQSEQRIQIFLQRDGLPEDQYDAFMLGTQVDGQVITLERADDREAGREAQTRQRADALLEAPQQGERQCCAGRGVPTPTTMRSGFIKSSTAKPSRRNSGLLMTSNSTFALQ